MNTVFYRFNNHIFLGFSSTLDKQVNFINFKNQIYLERNYLSFKINKNVQKDFSLKHQIFINSKIMNANRKISNSKHKNNFFYLKIKNTKMENLLIINEIGDMMLLEIINEKLKQMKCWNKFPPLFCQ